MISNTWAPAAVLLVALCFVSSFHEAAGQSLPNSPLPTASRTCLDEASDVTSPALGNLAGTLVLLEQDRYCLVVTGGLLHVTLDTVSQATAVDLATCIQTHGGTMIACWDDEVACSHPPSNGFACPSGGVVVGAGTYVLWIVRLDHPNHDESPWLGRYSGFVRDASLPAIAFQV